MTESPDDSNRFPSPSASPPDASEDAFDARSREVGAPTIGLTTFASLRHGERFSLATGGGVLSMAQDSMADGVPKPDTSRPDHLDDFEIIEPLGEGGMGVVYLARQLAPVRRDVAIKVLRSTFASPAARGRFEAERQAMARLAHPHVAQIFAAGAGEDGHPYLVMEHVPGPAITAYCDQHQLSLQRRLELFRLVCSGVQHAHQKGVLHRDIKPSNILVVEVDGQPLPKIIDFGIAKGLEKPLLDDHQATEAGLMGTPGYFSPEMVRSEADIDTRSDVYALGVLLYELLVGVRPFDSGGDSVFEVLRRIVNDDPESPKRRWRQLDVEQQRVAATARDAKPSTFGRQLTADLDAIVLRAIANDRNDRYPTAASLADDVARFLGHEPVEARSVSGWYRLGKLARRHRGVAVVGVLLVLSLITGLVARTLEARRANREAMAAKQVTAFLVDIFEAPDPRGRAEGDVTARALLDRGASRLRDALTDQPLVRAELLDTIGTVYRHLGTYDEAAALTREALDLRVAHRPADHADIATSREHLAVAEIRAGRFAEAEALLRAVVDRHERVHGPHRLDLAAPLTQLGRAVGNQGHLEDALAHFERAVAIHDAHPNTDPLAHAESLRGLAHTKRLRGSIPDAINLARRVVTLRESRLGADHVLVADALVRLADYHAGATEFDAARPLLERALSIVDRVYGLNHPESMPALIALGHVETTVGRIAEAKVVFERANAIALQHEDVDPNQRAMAVGGLYRVAYALEDWTASEHYARSRTEMLRAFLPADHPETAFSINDIGVVLASQKRLDEAEVAYAEAHAMFERTLGADHPDTMVPLNNLAEVLQSQGRFDEGEALLLRVMATWERVYGSEHPYVAATCHALGDLYWELERWPEAEARYRCAVRVREAIFEEETWELTSARERLAAVLRQLGRDQKALAPVDAE